MEAQRRALSPSSQQHTLKHLFPFLLLFAQVGYTQPYSIPFDIIGVDDRMDSVALEQLKRGSYDLILPDGNYQKGPEDANENEGLALITKEEDIYLIHMVHFGGDRDRSSGPVTRSEDGRYFLAHSAFGNFIRGQETEGRELCIIDPRNATLAKLETYAYNFEWTFDPDTEQQLDNKTSSVIQGLLQGDTLTLFNTCTEGSMIIPCAVPGSVYVIGMGALTRTKEYDPDRLCMVPIRYAGPIATGMWLHDVGDIHPYGSTYSAAQLEYGLEPSEQNDSGLVVTDGNTAMCFLRMRARPQNERVKTLLRSADVHDRGCIRETRVPN